MLTDTDIRAWESDMRRLLGAGLSLASDPQIARGIAKVYRTLYEALVAAGFSRKDAVTIVAASHVTDMKR